MSKRKNHHYIPQFYLKQFSVDEVARNIGVYNYSNGVCVKSASIRHQASEKYLYGDDDEVEAELSKLEGSTSQLFNIMLQHLVPPPEDSPAFNVLKTYILYQSFRTPKAGEEVSEVINQAALVYLKVYHPDKLEEFKRSRVVHENPVLLALMHSADMVPLLGYLSCKLIVNLSQLPFITSDSPVVYYNQFLESKGHYVGATAVVVKGLQIFLPIHPRLMLCLYDPEIYTIGEAEKLTVVTESIDEVHQLNGLQYLQSRSQIFFGEFIEKDYLDLLVSKYQSLKPSMRSFTTLSDRLGGGHYAFTSSKDASINLSLEFFKIKRRASEMKIDHLAPVRHESFEEIRKQRDKERKERGGLI